MSYIDLNHEEDLWKWMESLEKQGMKVIAIPHNSNASKGRMFARRLDGQSLHLSTPK